MMYIGLLNACVCRARSLVAWLIGGVSLLFAFATVAFASMDATQNGGWISIGIPNYMHLGTDGTFYLNGTDQGMCAGVRPSYIRFNTGKDHWKEMYVMIQVAAANDRPMDCVIDTGCGTSELWVSYCRTPLR